MADFVSYRKSMSFKKGILLIFFLLCNFAIAVSSSDSVAVRKSLFIIPHPGYQQETSWLGGIAGGYYFKSNDLKRISSISGSADYTLLKQFIFNITPKIYLADNKWYFYSNLNFRKYPDFYYGIGNKPTNIEQLFTSNVFGLTLQPQYALTSKIYIGPQLNIRYEKLFPGVGFDAVRDEIFNRFGSEGWKEPFYSTSLGALISFDSRDNQFYPYKGVFAKTTIAFSKEGLGSTHSISDFTFDVRHYLRLFGEHVFAWQMYFESALSSHEIPFQLLPTLGGRDILRGFRQGMYRDNLLALLQTEYRLPVYKRLKAAVFLSAGDVMNYQSPMIDKIKVAYGVGLRYRLNDARVHLRVDIAKNNYGEKMQFYITATEAF